VGTLLFRYDGQGFHPVDSGVEHLLRWVAWRNDGQAALIVGNAGTILRYDNGDFVPVPSPTTENLRGAIWAPDGRSALIVGNHGTVLRYRERGVEVITPITTQHLRRVDYRPDGRFALIVGNNGTVLRFEGGALTVVPTERAHTLRAVAYRPDGAYALVGAYASRWVGHPRPHALYRCDGAYLTAMMTTDDEDDLVRINWHHDGQTALVVGHSWHIFGPGEHNKVFTYDGFGYQFYRVPTDAQLLGGAWQPGTDGALIVGDQGTALWFSHGTFSPLESGTRLPLMGPYWHPQSEWAFVLVAGSRLYTT
jgi:photosystem II stability/assembly factor-like uncharacterized protein